MQWRGVIGAVLFATAGLASCGGSSEDSRIRGGTLTIYSSLPAHGVSAQAARAVAAGESLALSDAGSRAAHRRVRLVRLDSTRPGGRIWDPALVSANAKRAARDPTAVAYLGELDYGGSAVSVPINNEKGILQVSPGDGLASLTSATPARPQAGPARYYPTDERTFVRLVPSDLRTAESLRAQARAAGAERLAVVFDGHVYARELTAELLARARRVGPDPVESEELHGDPARMPDFVRDLAAKRPDAIVYAGVAGRLTGPLLDALARLVPKVPVFAAPGILARRSPLSSAPERVEAVSSVPPASEVREHDRRLLRRIARYAGRKSVGAEALDGYEAMRLVLDAVQRAGPSRRGVVKAARRDGRAHTADPLYLYRLVEGRFVFERKLG